MSGLNLTNPVPRRQMGVGKTGKMIALLLGRCEVSFRNVQHKIQLAPISAVQSIT